jgi:hypothetical protein
MKTLEDERNWGEFSNQETYGFIQCIQTNDILHRLAFRFVNDEVVNVGEVGRFVSAMELLSNIGCKVNSKDSPAWLMSLAMGGAVECFTKVHSVVLTDWLNDEFKPVRH